MDFRFIDLFAGIGGMRLGFEYVGGVCVFSSEWDKSAQATYLANFNEIPYGDITKIHSDDIKDHEILLAGFPCQPFSSIGKREGFLHDTQGTLFDEVKRIIADKKPKAFLLENVKGLTTHDNGHTLRVIRSSLEELGYDLNIKILNSADYGVPQNRERIYIVGFRSDSVSAFSDFLWPAKAKTKKGIGQFIESGVTDRSISKHLQESYIFKLNDGRPERVDQKSNIQVKTLVASYHKIQRLTGTFVQDGPTGLRLFTTEECKAVMGFPKSFKVPVSRTQTFRQFGNSVAVPVIKAIANEIVKVLQSSSN
jgi:DNA (cytosine-5)-methyltransferase 1